MAMPRTPGKAGLRSVARPAPSKTFTSLSPCSVSIPGTWSFPIPAAWCVAQPRGGWLFCRGVPVAARRAKLVCFQLRHSGFQPECT
eukprot:737660-Rhodomonas_salina.1